MGGAVENGVRGWVLFIWGFLVIEDEMAVSGVSEVVGRMGRRGLGWG